MPRSAPERVWRIARDLLAYPKFMNQVLSVKPVESAAGETLTAWVVLFNGNELQWTENDQYDEALRRLKFTQIDGDLAEWRGYFEATAEREGTLARYLIEFDLGVPALADVLHPLGERAIRSNCDQMLREIETRTIVLDSE